MHNDPQIQEKALRPREPSLPDGAYRLMHMLGALDVDQQQFEALMELHQGIREGTIDAAPSRLSETVQRVLCAAGLSTMTEEQQIDFFRKCEEADL